MTVLTDYILLYHFGDWSSIFGFFIAFIGFFVTIWNVWRTKSAAEQAREMVIKIREDMRRMDTMSDFTAALSSMEEILRLQRKEAWDLVPDRYNALKSKLITVKGISPDLSDKQKAVVQNTIQYFTGMEKIVDEALIKNEPPQNRTRLNSIVSKQIDAIREITVEIRNRLGR